MKIKHIWMLFTSVILCVLYLLADEYIYNMPAAVEYSTTAIALVLLIVFAVINRKVLAGNQNRRLRK